MFKFELGLKATTKVTKQKGIITSRSENLFGCNRYYIQPEADKEGKVIDGFWTDEEDLVVSKGKPINALKKNTGGPMSKIR